MLSLRCIAALLLLATPFASATPTSRPADDEAVRTGVTRLIPATSQVQGISATPVPGLRQVIVDGRVLYATTDGKYLLQGPLVATATGQNLTEASEAVLHQALLARIGPERRIVFPAAHPKFRVTVFTDVDCGYCRKLHSQIAEYNAAGITVEYLFFPRTGLQSEAYTKSVSVWCSSDRRSALTAAKTGHAIAAKACSNPVADDYALGQRLGISGTPAIFAENGMQVGGYLTPADMLARLEHLRAATNR